MLTPEDIFEKEFSRSVRGYNIDEVNEFLDLIIQDLARLAEENKQLKKENQNLKSSSSRQNYFSTGDNETNIHDLLKRIEILEKKTKFL